MNGNLKIEQKLLKHLAQHPRIIRSKGLTEDGLLLRYAENGTLHDYIPQQTTLCTPQRTRLCVQIAKALYISIVNMSIMGISGPARQYTA